MRDWRSGGISVPFGTFHHFSRQLRQQHAQACCALKTGCPRIGVCLPSLGGHAGASRVRTKSLAWRLIVSIPFSAMYFLSASESRKRLLNLDFASLRNAASAAEWLRKGMSGGYLDSSARMASSTSARGAVGSKRRTMRPSFPIRNFVKFHLMSGFFA